MKAIYAKIILHGFRGGIKIMNLPAGRQARNDGS